MPTLVDQAWDELQRLPAAEQEAIAHELLQVTRAERRWDQLFADGAP